MKVVRVTFGISGFGQSTYFFDRMYDENLSDQENCDAQLKYLIDGMGSGMAIALMRKDKPEDDTQVIPVVISFKNVVEVAILNVAVYNVEKKEPENAE